jgi:DNA-binding MarR family transcriptional regulator
MAAECPALRVRQASRVLAKLFDDELAPFGLLSSQLPILAAVALFGASGAPMSRLAEALLVDRTTLTRGIRPLERAKLLRVVHSPHDARTKIVVVTRSGQRMIEAIYPAWERILGQIKKFLGAQTLVELHAQLDHVIALAPAAGRNPLSGEGGISSDGATKGKHGHG